MKRKLPALSYSTMLVLASLFTGGRALADSVPDQFTFNPTNGVPLNITVYSNANKVAGIDEPATISVTGGTYSVNYSPFTAEPGTVKLGDTFAVAVQTPNEYGKTVTATLNIGGITADYEVTTDAVDMSPDQFSFIPKSNVAVGTQVVSDPITISGLAAPTYASTTGGEYSINNGVDFVTSGMVANGDKVIVRQTASANPGTMTWTTFSAHYVYADFFVTTAGTSADQFTFAPKTDVAAGSVVESDPIIVSGLTGQGVISIENGEFKIGTGEFRSTPTTIQNNDHVVVRQTASATAGQSKTATLTIGNTSGNFVVTTAGIIGDTTPDPFSFTAQTDVPLSTVVLSDPASITGIDNGTPISIIGGEYSLDNGTTFTSADGTIDNNQTVIVRQTSASAPLTKTTATLTVGTASQPFDVTTFNADVTPDAFSFAPKADVPLNSPITSDPVTINGIDNGTAISIANGEYSLDNGATFTSTTGTIDNGQSVVVRLTSSNQPLTPVTATLTVGTESQSFVVTTQNVDITPDTFSFPAKTGVALNTLITSDPATITGIDNGTAISITNGEYSLDNGTTFTSSAGTIDNNQTVIVRQTSALTPLTTSTATLTVGTASVPFDVTTTDVDISPDTFSFDAVLNAPLATLVESNTVTISGINTATTISIVGGEYKIGSGDYTSLPGTISNGETVTVRQTSASTPLTTSTATLTVGTASVPFDVTTLALVNVAPVIQDIPNQNAVVNTLFTFQVQASDANGDTLTYSLSSNTPSGLTIDAKTGMISWTPTILGTFTFDVTVTDGTLSDTKTMTIIVTEVPVVVVTENRGDHGDGCDLTCERYKEYRRKYKNPEYKELYFMMKDWDETNPAEFQRLQAIYLKYKKLSDNELSQLPADVQRDFKTFKHFNGYKHYRHLKEERHK